MASKMKSQISLKSCYVSILLFLQIATLRNKRNLAAVNRASQEEHSRNNLSWDGIVSSVNEDYFTQISEESE